MAEEENVTLAAASVLPRIEVDINETEVVAHTTTNDKGAADDVATTKSKDVKMVDEPAPTETNGHAEKPDASSAPANAATSSLPEGEAKHEDIVMEDADEAVRAPEAGVEDLVKKTPNGSSKKKSAGVPEHKSKKLNKKKPKPILRLDATPGELYLARLKGHQPWPSIICDEDMLPENLLNSRPVTTAQADGTFKRPDYAPGGKRENERTFPIMFLHTNEFSWIINSELTPITPQECADMPEKGKSKGLVEAYKKAAEGKDLEFYKEVLKDHGAALAEEEERLAQKVAEKAQKEAEKAERETNKSQKGKRKSGVSAADDADTMDVDEGGESKPKSKKRKKSMDNGEDEKPAKTPKTSTKLKLTTPKTPAESAKKKSAKPKSSGKKSKAVVQSDEESESPKVEEVPLTPEAAREKKEKEIRYFRHKLQKGFISRDDIPKDEEIQSMSTYLRQLENVPDLEGGIIRSTKINKVLKAMIRLPSIPKDEEFHFKKRSQDLLAKWNLILSSEPTDDKDVEKDKDTDKAADLKAQTNGDSKTDVAKTDKADASAEVEAADGIAPEIRPEELEKKVGTTVEGAKEAEPEASESTKPVEDAKTDEPDVEKPAEAFEPPAETSA